jgi:hypothetical protein
MILKIMRLSFNLFLAKCSFIIHQSLLILNQNQLYNQNHNYYAEHYNVLILLFIIFFSKFRQNYY